MNNTTAKKTVKNTSSERSGKKMKIAIFGATGRVGTRVLQHLLNEGYEVTALVRSPEKLSAHKNLKVIVGDVTEFDNVEQTINGNSLVFSGLNTDKTTTLSVSIVHIITAMKKHKVERVVTIGTAGILDSRVEPNKLRYRSTESKRKTTAAAEEHEMVYRKLEQTTLQWTIICPTALLDESEVANYRYEIDFLPEEGREISVLDTAAFSFEVIKKGQFLQHRVGIAY